MAGKAKRGEVDPILQLARKIADATPRAVLGDEGDSDLRLVKTFPGFNRAITGTSAETPGGCPLGSTGLVVGPEGSGKTAFLAGLAISFQQAGGLVHYVDAEMALDRTWFHDGGLEVARDRFVYVGRRPGHKGKRPPPLYYEEAIDSIDAAISNYADTSAQHDVGPLLIVVDSLARLIPKKIATKMKREKDMRSIALGREQAAWNTTWGAKLLTQIADLDVTVMFVQHIMEEQQKGLGHGEAFKIKGGRGIRFDAAIVAEAKFAGRCFDVAAKEGETHPAVAKKHRINVRKTKVGPQAYGSDSQFEFYISTGRGMLPKGWDRHREILNEGVRRGTIETSTGKAWAWDFNPTLGSRFVFDKQSFTLKKLYQDADLFASLCEAIT